MNLKSFLKFEIDYIDGELIELQINGSNCYYKGETNVYVNITQIANKKSGFAILYGSDNRL